MNKEESATWPLVIESDQSDNSSHDEDERPTYKLLKQQGSNDSIFHVNNSKECSKSKHFRNRAKYRNNNILKIKKNQRKDKYCGLCCFTEQKGMSEI